MFVLFYFKNLIDENNNNYSTYVAGGKRIPVWITPTWYAKMMLGGAV